MASGLVTLNGSNLEDVALSIRKKLAGKKFTAIVLREDHESKMVVLANQTLENLTFETVDGESKLTILTTDELFVFRSDLMDLARNKPWVSVLADRVVIERLVNEKDRTVLFVLNQR